MATGPSALVSSPQDAGRHGLSKPALWGSYRQIEGVMCPKTERMILSKAGLCPQKEGQVKSQSRLTTMC